MIRYYTIPYHTIPYYTIIYYTMLCYPTILCYVALYCTVPQISYLAKFGKNLVGEIVYFVVFLICKGGTLTQNNYNH